MTDIEAAWLAGLLEGEGSFFMVRRPAEGNRSAYAHPKIQVSMTDRDVIARVAELLGNRVHEAKRGPAAKEHWKPIWHAYVSGAKAVEIMRQIRPWLGERRGAKVDELIEEFDTRPSVRDVLVQTTAKKHRVNGRFAREGASV